MKIRIREARDKKGWTQEELAKKVNLSRSYLAQIEAGTRHLTAKKQAAIAAALSVDPSELVDFTAPDKSDEDLLLEAFRSLTPEQRKSWLELARVAAGTIPESE